MCAHPTPVGIFPQKPTVHAMDFNLSEKELSLAIYALLQLRERDAHLLALRLQHAVATDLELDQDEGESYDPSGEQEFQTHHYHCLTRSIAHRSRHHPYVEGENLDEGQEVGAGIAEPRSKPKRKCKCNGAALQAAVNWEIGENMAKTSNASCEAIISALAVAHPQVLQQDIDTWIASLATGATHITFLSVVSQIQLAVKCQRVPTLRTFVEWNTFGSKFALLAGGGTLYILLIIAGLDLRWSVAKAHGRVLWEVAKLLRAPDDSLILMHSSNLSNSTTMYYPQDPHHGRTTSLWTSRALLHLPRWSWNSEIGTVDPNLGGRNLASRRATQASHPGFQILQDNLCTIKGHVRRSPAALGTW
ncbi:uncharacterized protein HD556DRAFT_1304758 [Suillus plorans]|uniref:Uncharacterized protein n=1 Tax=Suillus plorans TaxID=116603 RepID=A0A9P7J3C9_9AGAM|nr:uncharacterized protein HD556DRAFT_1304758 [Suillus plorans]KAG1800743.1 hypothetical protein HD556DRAFT_1304758 [Suillus plorans]